MNINRSALALAPVLLGLSLQSQLAAQIIILPPAAPALTEEASLLRKVKVVSSTVAYTCPATGVWADIPGASAAFTIPALNKDLFVGRFFAESAFSGAASWGSVRMLLNGVEMNPVVGSDYAFDSNDGGNQGASSWEGHSVGRSKSLTAGLVPLGATVKVQCRAPAGTTFRIDDWHLTVEQFH